MGNNEYYQFLGQYTVNLDQDNRLLLLNGGIVSGSACFLEFDDDDARVICRQLGYGLNATYYPLLPSSYPHALFNVRCNGNENSLDECPYDTYDQSLACFGATDVGIQCSGSTGTQGILFNWMQWDNSSLLFVFSFFNACMLGKYDMISLPKVKTSLEINQIKEKVNIHHDKAPFN